MWALCIVECFLFRVGIVLSLLGCIMVHTVGDSFQSCRYRRLVDISGWGTARRFAHLDEIARHFASFPLAASGVDSTRGHPFSCGTACTICEFSNGAHQHSFDLHLFFHCSFNPDVCLSYSCWIRTEPCHCCIFFFFRCGLFLNRDLWERSALKC